MDRVPTYQKCQGVPLATSDNARCTTPTLTRLRGLTNDPGARGRHLPSLIAASSVGVEKWVGLDPWLATAVCVTIFLVVLVWALWQRRHL